MMAFHEVTIGPCRLILADCLDVLPTLSGVDITVSSPPYNISGGKHGASGRYKDSPLNISGEWYDDCMPEDEYQSWLNTVIAACAKVSRGLVWVNHKVRFKDRVALHPVRFIEQPIYSEVIWSRSGATAFNCKKFAPSHESIWGFGVPHWWNDDSNVLLTVWRINQDSTSHPCSYPVEIPERLAEASCPPDGTVLDPFMGSGTTGVACIRTGRQFIGIEKEPKYFEIACNRIRRAWQDKCSEIKWDEPPKLKQRELIGAE